MNDSALNLLKILSDGQWVSGESLGEQLGVTRAAIWKTVKVLQSYGVFIESVKGSGYRVNGGVSLLDGDRVSQRLLGATVTPLNVVVLQRVDSTNQYLLDKVAAKKSVHGDVVLAESQTSGRGRRGRQWQSPYAQNLCFSMGWQFDGGASQLQGLSLAVSLVIAEQIEGAYGLDVSLKWPNDLLIEGKKLGGILLEVSGDLSGECSVVVGIGLNINMRLLGAQVIDQPWLSLVQALEASQSAKEGRLDRESIAVQLVIGLSEMFEIFPSGGFAALRKRWESRCAHIGKQVALNSASDTVSGEMMGVTPAGELLLKVDEGEGNSQILTLSGGEVSLKAAV